MAQAAARAAAGQGVAVRLLQARDATAEDVLGADAYLFATPENLAAMNVGVASHNLFDLGYGLVLAHERGALDRVQFEMLEGMANAQRRALFELTRNLLL